MLSHTNYLDQRRFESLDGLRAISILLVFTAHPASQHLWPRFHGSAGVTLFFVLSGFLITTLLLREESKAGRVSFSAFYIRRLFRIYPMFFLVLGLYCVLIYGLGLQPERRAAFTENLPYFLLFFPEHSIFFNSTSVEVPFNMAWSIGIEEKFYLVWPLLGFGLLAHRRVRRLSVLVTIAVALAVVSLLPFDWTRAVAPYAHIAFGSLAAVLLHSGKTFHVVAVLGRRSVLAGVVLLAIALQLGTDEILGGGRLYVAYGFVVACVVIGLVTSAHPEYNWLSSRPMLYLAGLSYVLYLIHNFGLNLAEAVIPNSASMPWSLLSTTLGIGVSVMAAGFIHAYYEEPLRRLGVRISSRQRARLDAAPPEQTWPHDPSGSTIGKPVAARSD